MDWSAIFSGAALLACGIFFLSMRSYVRRRTGPDRLLAEFREEVSKLIAEIDEATDKDARLVEERIKTLRGILEEVDKRIGLHLREMDRRRFQEEAYAELGRKRSIIAGGTGGISQKTAKAVDLFPVSAQAVPDIVTFPESGLSPQESLGPRIIVAEKQIEPKPLSIREQILDLSRAGLDSRLIALRLGVSIAEVETAIAIAENL